MKKISNTVKSKNYFKELKKLLSNAVSDFSNVKVAAIIVTDKGIFKGVNVEDPVLNLGICAERNAIFSAVTNGMKKVYAIHILSNLKDRELNMCGACRQLATTYMNLNDKVYIYNIMRGTRSVYTLGQLLPHANKKIVSPIKEKNR